MSVSPRQRDRRLVHPHGSVGARSKDSPPRAPAPRDTGGHGRARQRSGRGARPLRVVQTAGNVCRRPSQHVADLVGRELRPLRQQQRRGTGDDSGRLRGAAALEEPVADPAGRPCVWSMYEPGARRLTTDTPGATRSGARLPVRPAPRLENEGTVSSRCRRAPGVQGCRPRARPVESAGLAARRAAAAVAGGHDDDDAAGPGHLGGVRQRVEAVVLRRVGAEGEVEHPDVQARRRARGRRPSRSPRSPARRRCARARRPA